MQIPILLYHSVSETVSQHFHRWAVQPGVFEEHMAYLRNQDYTPVPLADIAAAIVNSTRRLPKRPVGITFDDGYEDFYVNAVPILEKYHVPCTIFIVAGYIGSTSQWLDAEGEGNRRMMSWEQIRGLAQARVEVGAHTLHHPHLDTMERKAAYREILGSKEILEQNLGLPVVSFAYPHGYHSQQITQMVKQAGFAYACAVKHGLSSTNDNHYALARVIVSRDTSPEGLGDLLHGKGLMKVTGEERLRTKVWRMVRRMVFRMRGIDLPANIAKGSDPLYGNPTERH